MQNRKFRSLADKYTNKDALKYAQKADPTCVSKTKQAEAASCDINNIVKKYQQTGLIQARIKENPQFGDFSTMQSYHAAMNTVVHAQSQFMAMDAHLRERFQNDPARFLEFVADPKNKEEMVKMGFAIAKPEPEVPPELPKTPKVEKKPKTDTSDGA